MIYHKGRDGAPDVTHYAILHGQEDIIKRVALVAKDFFLDATFKISPIVDPHLYNTKSNQVSQTFFTEHKYFDLPYQFLLIKLFHVKKCTYTICFDLPFTGP